MDDARLSDLIKILEPEELQKEGIQQKSVTRSAHVFYSEFTTFEKASDDIAMRGLEFGGRILLTGPPGTNFINFIYTLCTEIPLKLLQFQWPSQIECNIAQSAIGTLFELARREKPILIYISNIENIHSYPATTVRLILNEMANTTWDKDEILIVATSLHPDRVDEHIMVLFDRIYVFGNATEEDRMHVLSEAMAGIDNVDIKSIVELTDGWGFSDILHLATAIAIKRKSEDITLKTVNDLLQKGGIVPVGGTLGTKEIMCQMMDHKTTTERLDHIYPDDFLDQLYLMAVTDDYGRAQSVVEALNAEMPLSVKDKDFLTRYPFLLVGGSEERLMRLIRAKKSHDRLKRVMGRGR